MGLAERHFKANFKSYWGKRVPLDAVLKLVAVTVPRLAETKSTWTPCHLMKPNPKALSSLADIEREVVAESREWATSGETPAKTRR